MARITKGKPVVNVDYLKEVDMARRDLRLRERRKELSATDLLRLAVYDALTYDRSTGTGGPNGSICTERELGYSTNSGLEEISASLKELQAKYEHITLADVVQLGGIVAVEALGGPTVPFTPGRKDSRASPPQGRIPSASDCTERPGALVAVLERMGLPKCYAVPLSGAHPFGRAWASGHRDGGCDSPWDTSFFRELLAAGKEGAVRSMPVDAAIVQDPELRALVEVYAADEQKWLDDYAEAFKAISEAGCGLAASPLAAPALREPLTWSSSARAREAEKTEAANRRAASHWLEPPQTLWAAGVAAAAMFAGAFYW
eukprot:CAMPEP_0177586388 /NCGR_PEP_ID=MMETSP0419_2-20121207/5044_1 /TAXON_ID=582737 /ORGANISM="Tetraselmis sp., Strain GSL018" /LENGTH=315 /DNA_ID=CAMNT_0019076273 /DNA_START=29 /DNA_END=973 /DNA_ORIENTATION=+